LAVFQQAAQPSAVLKPAIPPADGPIAPDARGIDARGIDARAGTSPAGVRKLCAQNYAKPQNLISLGKNSVFAVLKEGFAGIRKTPAKPQNPLAEVLRGFA